VTQENDKKTVERLLEKILDSIEQDPGFMLGMRRQHETNKKMGIIYNMLIAQGYTLEEIAALAKMAAPYSTDADSDIAF
jgi:hypothetical protein